MCAASPRPYRPDAAPLTPSNTLLEPSSREPYSTGCAGEMPSLTLKKAARLVADLLFAAVREGRSHTACLPVQDRAAHRTRPFRSQRTRLCQRSALLPSQQPRAFPAPRHSKRPCPMRYLRLPEISATRCFNGFRISKPFDSREYRSGLSLLPVI